MKIVIAIDSFKGCLSSREANEAAGDGIKLPISDGGEGMTEAFKAMDLGYKDVTIDVHGPLMEPLTASYLISEDGKRAVMEMAAACGLPLVPFDKRNPEETTTFGFGEMLADAMRRGCKDIIIGIGGSATCDAGEGMLRALINANIISIENNTLLSTFENININVACDVQNPLFGINGASYVFSPQKGADEAMVERLDQRLKDFYNASGCTDSVPGDGAAGGLGFALRYFLKASLKPGIDVVLDAQNFDNIIEGSDLIITGEGKCDRQTLMGKVPYGILQRAKKSNIPVVLIAGKTEDEDILLDAGFKDVICVNKDDNRPLEILMQPDVAKQNITKTIKRYIDEIQSNSTRS